MEEGAKQEEDMKHSIIRIVLTVFLIALGGCSSKRTVIVHDDRDQCSECAMREPVLSDVSYGVIRFGDRLARAEQRLNEKATPGIGEYTCGYVTFRQYPGVEFMVEKGIVTRADIADASIPNILSVRIGTKLSKVKRRYPDVLIKRHQYEPDGHYLIFKSADQKKAIVLEETAGKITAIRAGLEPSVEYAEGCF